MGHSKRDMDTSLTDARKVNLLNAVVGARRKSNEGESLTRSLKRLAADLDYSDSAIKRAVKNGRVSERLHDALIQQIQREGKYTKRNIYFATRLMDNARGKRLAQMREQALHDSGAFRGRVVKYRKKIQGEFTKKSRRAEREKVLDLLGEGLEDVIFDTDVTPKA